MQLFLVRVYRRLEENLRHWGLFSESQLKVILECLGTSISEAMDEVLEEVIGHGS